jgi:hypothetical protein
LLCKFSTIFFKICTKYVETTCPACLCPRWLQLVAPHIGAQCYLPPQPGDYVDDVGGKRQPTTVCEWRCLAPRYMRDFKECIIVYFSLVPLEVPLKVRVHLCTHIRGVRACVRLYLYINLYKPPKRGMHAHISVVLNSVPCLFSQIF